MHTVQFLTHIVENNHTLAYFLIFLGLVFEGEVTLISAGVLAHLGALDFWKVLGFVFLGGVIKTLLGYYLGIFLNNKYNHNKFFGYIEKKVLTVLPRFKKKPFWSIFLSKFIMGVNYFVIIFAGYQKINFKKYLEIELLSTVIWAPLLLSLGYFFSYTALSVSKEVGRFLLVVIVFTLGFLLVDKVVASLYALFEDLRDKNNENKE